MAREVMMLASEVKSYLVDKLNDSAADGKTKSWVGLGRVGSLHLWVRLGRVKKLDQRPTVRYAVSYRITGYHHLYGTSLLPAIR